MNKKMIYFMFIFIGLLFFSPSVNASTKTGINIDAHEHFNYYYEQKHGTGFYNFLKTHPTEQDYVEFFNVSSGSIYNMYIFYANELEGHIYDYQAHNYLDAPLTVPSTAKYAILYQRYSNTCDPLGSYSINSNTYTFNYSRTGNVCVTNQRIAYFDDNGEFLSIIGAVKLDSLIYDFTISGHDDSSSADFTYMISQRYYYSNPSSSSNNIFQLGNKSFIITDIIDDEVHYLIDDNENYSGWLRRILSLWTIDYMSVVDTDLAYFKTNVIENTVPGLLEILSYGFTMSVPDDFTSLVLDNKHDNYLLIPKDINNSSLNRKFLVSTTELYNFNVFRVGVNTYDLNNNYTVPYEENVLQYIRFSQPNKLYVLDINKELRKINENYSLTNYAIGFGLFGNSVKYSANVYYNPNAYTVCLYYGGRNNNSCTFTNPVNNEEITLNNQQMYDILSSTNFSGASSNIFDSVEDQCKTAADYSDLYEYDDDCNIVGVKDNSSGVFESLSNISKFLSSFVAIITTIFSFAILLLDSLPPEIKSVLLFGLVGGTIVMLYKIIRG